jgi:ligand-binding sensor domain-containing protein
MGSNRLRTLSREGHLKTYSGINLAPDRPIRALWEDRNGNIWLGTNDGISRFRNGRFESLSMGAVPVHDRVRSIYEDVESNLWVGTNTGLSQFRDDPFTIYSKAEGLPSDEPTAVLQDRAGNIWVGFQNAGLLSMGPNRVHVFNRANGLPDDQVFSIRETPGGDLLISSRGGLTRLRDGHLTNFVPSRILNRQLVFDAIEDRRGHTWIANSDGLSELVSNRFQNVIPGGLTLKEYMNVLCEGTGSVLWAGSRGNGLWRLDQGKVQHFTTQNGLSSNQIRALVQQPDGTLWIGTFGGGLNRLRDGHFFQYTTKHGLLSDNISHIDDDHRGSLWLSTTRGICRVSKSELEALASGKLASLSTENYSVEDGLRSAQCGAGYPLACEAAVTKDGRFWFPTGKGLAVLDPSVAVRGQMTPPVHLVEILAEHRNPINPDYTQKFAAGTSDIQFRYAGIHLSSPEAVKYSYRLEGQGPAWIPVGKRRSITYTNLRFGSYRFVVKGELKNGLASEASYPFEILPHYYETLWFKCLIAILILAAAGSAYRLHVRQLHGRFALVLEERARIARDLHDTLAQGFVGISSQLDALATCLPKDPQRAHTFLDLARGMTRHCLNEARRTLMDLRVSALEGHDLAAALEAETLRWTAGSNLIVHLDVSKESKKLPHDIEQNLLRIAQEAVTNALKHASAARLSVLLKVDTQKLRLRVADDGRGCVSPDISSPVSGHLGLIGMRERAQSIGGEFRFQSQPETGTSIEVTVPLT